MAAVGLREKILIRPNQVCDLHAVPISVLARAKYVAIKVNRLISKGHNRRDFYLVAVLNLEVLQSLSDGFLIVVLRHIEPQHGPALMSFHSLYVNVAQSAGGQNASRKLQGFGEILFAFNSIDCVTLSQAFDRDVRAE